MKRISFNDVIFTAPYDVVKQGATIRMEILKEDYTLTEIAPIVSGVENIEVYDGDELTAIYTNYVDLVALQIFDDFPIKGETMGSVISITLSNPDIDTQIDVINNTIVSVQNEVDDIEQVQDAHSDNISELNTRVDEITPYTVTKVGYYGETEKTFYNVPEGNVSVFFDNYNGEYSTKRIENRLTVSFDALEDETNITISIQ